MLEVSDEKQTREFGERLGGLFSGGEVVELIGDIGAGKTTLTRGIAYGMGVDEVVQSPSFTISRLYDAPSGRRLAHYDFHRLSDPGIMADELDDTIGTKGTVVIIEWADTVEQTLPKDRLTITITPTAENTRQLTFASGGEVSAQLIEALK